MIRTRILTREAKRTEEREIAAAWTMKKLPIGDGHRIVAIVNNPDTDGIDVYTTDPAHRHVFISNAALVTL